MFKDWLVTTCTIYRPSLDGGGLDEVSLPRVPGTNDHIHIAVQTQTHTTPKVTRWPDLLQHLIHFRESKSHMLVYVCLPKPDLKLHDQKTVVLIIRRRLHNCFPVHWSKQHREPHRELSSGNAGSSFSRSVPFPSSLPSLARLVLRRRTTTPTAPEAPSLL